MTNSRLLVLLLLLAAGLASCRSVQINSFSSLHKSTAEARARLLKQKTLVVVLDPQNNPLDSVLPSVMEKYWTFCNIKYVEPGEARNHLRPGNFVLSFSRQYVTMPTGNGYPGFTVYTGRPRIQSLSEADVLTFVPAPHEINADSASLLNTHSEFMASMYIQRLQKQLFDLTRKKRVITRKGPQIGTVFFNGQKKLASSTTLLVREGMVPEEKLGDLARSLGTRYENIEVVSASRMEEFAKEGSPKVLFIFEKQFNPYTNGAGEGFYVYDNNGAPVAVTSILTFQERRELIAQRNMKVMGYVFGPVISVGYAVLQYGPYLLILL